MRNGQNKRMRNRNRRSQNPLSRVFESSGPDVKIRGTATQVAEKYVQLARDAQSSGDPVAAENYYQHAEHYFRIIASAQEQLRQTQPYYRNEGDYRDDGGDDADGDSYQPYGEPGPAPREQMQPVPRQREHQPYPPREQQSFQRREPPGERAQPAMGGDEDTVERLPSFITGGAAQSASGGNGGDRPSGGDRYAHRRRRRPHGPREGGGPSQSQGGDDFGDGRGLGPNGD
jgi:hypothetical protein